MQALVLDEGIPVINKANLIPLCSNNIAITVRLNNWKKFEDDFLRMLPIGTPMYYHT